MKWARSPIRGFKNYRRGFRKTKMTSIRINMTSIRIKMTSKFLFWGPRNHGGVILCKLRMDFGNYFHFSQRIHHHHKYSWPSNKISIKQTKSNPMLKPKPKPNPKPKLTPKPNLTPNPTPTDKTKCRNRKWFGFCNLNLFNRLPVRYHHSFLDPLTLEVNEKNWRRLNKKLKNKLLTRKRTIDP